jgi:hypothetical protein
MCDVEGVADRLNDKLGAGGCAEAIRLNGDWYVVTTGTGDGICAYCPEDLKIDQDAAALAAEAREQDRETPRDWSYQIFCDRNNYVVGLDVAVAYYLMTGRSLSDGGSDILSEDHQELLDVVRKIRARS